MLGPSFAQFATLEPGTSADIVLFDPDREWVVKPQEFESKGKNTPLQDTILKGRVMLTMVEGKIVYSLAES